MFKKLEKVEERFLELEHRLVDSAGMSNQDEYRRISVERSEIAQIVETYREYRKVLREVESSRELLQDGDPELSMLAREELPELEAQIEKFTVKLRALIAPKDPLDDKDVFLEIRAGAGGGEAGLFAANLFRMYSRYAERKRWKVEIMSSNETGIGGYKEIIALIRGKGAYSRLKFERGVHRVQRIPVTESGGRIHTSTSTVAVMPEADDVEVHIADNDLRIDVFRSGGPGGQSVNTTDSAVRITHIPTGLVVSCQDEKSQHKNKAKGMRILKVRLQELARQEQEAEISSDRRSQVGTGERSEKIRTYNYPQNRVTDHRIGVSIHQLSEFMDGALDDMIDQLATNFQTEALENVK